MTKYAKQIISSRIDLGNGQEARAERIFVKDTNREEIRFSWWTQEGKQFQRTPLDLTEEDWLRLFESAVKEDVFSNEFINNLSEILKK